MLILIKILFFNHRVSFVLRINFQSFIHYTYNLQQNQNNYYEVGSALAVDQWHCTAVVSSAELRAVTQHRIFFPFFFFFTVYFLFILAPVIDDNSIGHCSVPSIRSMSASLLSFFFCRNVFTFYRRCFVSHSISEWDRVGTTKGRETRDEKGTIMEFNRLRLLS